MYEVLNAQKDLTSILSTNPLALRLTLTHTFMRIGGQEFLLRFPYAAFGILGVILMYQVGRTLFDDGTGIIAAFLLAISPFHIQYSQEARSYSLTILLILTSLYCLVRALQDNQLKHWAGFAFVTTMSLNNHLTAASVVASEIAYGALVLLIERISRPADQQQPRGRKHPASSQNRGRLCDWLHWLRSSRGAMLTLSSLVGIVLFLLFRGTWFSYLSQIGLSTAGSGTGGNDAILRISDAFIRKLLSDFGAGNGLVLYLFGAAFLAGLVSCAVDRQWRQLLLAPIWILPPLFILSRISASAYFSSKHLIFILPAYLLFAARGITGIGKIATQHLGLSAGTKKLLWVTCLMLVTGALAWFSVPGVQAYYKGHKENWRGVATLISEEAKPGDLVVQLLIWPTDPVPYYLGSLPGGTDIKLVTIDSASESDFPTRVWWVMTVGQPGTRLSPLPAPEELVGSEFDVYSFYSHPFKSPALVRRKTPIANRAEFLQLAVKLSLVQAQSDSRGKFEWHLSRLSQVTGLPGTSQVQSECPPEFSDPDKYIQAAREQFQNAQRQEALDSILKAMALYELLYPGHGRPHDSVLQALYSLGDSALESGHRACSVLFYSRAAEAHMLDVETDPDSVDHWQNLAEALVKAARHKDAVAAYERLLELVPGRWEYHVRLARSYRASGQHEKGIDTLEQAVKLAPAEPQLRRYLADAYFLDGRMAEAAIAYRHRLEATPGDIEARFGLALAYDALGRESESIREFQTLIEIDPDHWLVPEAKERLDAVEQ
jgi:tetratricopeptide (TPR) repeat protein